MTTKDQQAKSKKNFKQLLIPFFCLGVSSVTFSGYLIVKCQFDCKKNVYKLIKTEQDTKY